jgi:hypothetical protein
MFEEIEPKTEPAKGTMNTSPSPSHQLYSLETSSNPSSNNSSTKSEKPLPLIAVCENKNPLKQISSTMTSLSKLTGSTTNTSRSELHDSSEVSSNVSIVKSDLDSGEPLPLVATFESQNALAKIISRNVDTPSADNSGHDQVYGGKKRVTTMEMGYGDFCFGREIEYRHEIMTSGRSLAFSTSFMANNVRVEGFVNL